MEKPDRCAPWQTISGDFYKSVNAIGACTPWFDAKAFGRTTNGSTGFTAQRDWQYDGVGSGMASPSSGWFSNAPLARIRSGRWISLAMPWPMGRRIKVLTIVDDYSKEAIDLVADFRISGLYVTRS